MFRIMALVLVLAPSLYLPHAAAPPFTPHERTFKVAQYCIPQDHDAERLFCRA
jgi:hypothetical protein